MLLALALIPVAQGAEERRARLVSIRNAGSTTAQVTVTWREPFTSEAALLLPLYVTGK